MSKRKASAKKPNLPKIAAEKKHSIINAAHERLRTFKPARAFVLKDQAVDVKNWLEKQPEVESVTLIGDSDITVKFKDNTQVGIMLNRKEMYGGNVQAGEAEETELVLHMQVSGTENGGDPHPVSRKACVIDTLFDDWPPQSTPNNIVTTLQNAGYEVDFVKNNEANLNFFAHIDEKESASFSSARTEA